MKTALIVAYILTVLVISGMARASVIVNNFSVDPKFHKLSVSGIVTDQCEPDLKIQLARPDFFEGESLGENFKNHKIRLMVINTNSSKICNLESNTVSQFDLIYDLKTLGLQPDDYSLISIEGNVNLQSTSLNNSTDNSTSFRGLVVQIANGSFVVVDNNRRFYNIESSIDLSRYVGKIVHVSGFEFLHQLGPILEVNSHDPLTEIPNEVGPKMFVMGICSLPQ